MNEQDLTEAFVSGIKKLSRSFLTGSRVYGEPRKDSDIDLVVLVSYGDLLKLSLIADVLSDGVESKTMETVGGNKGSASDIVTGASLRFGSLNLIALTDIVEFEAWRDATNYLREKRDEQLKPVTRKRAVKVIKKYVAFYKGEDEG